MSDTFNRDLLRSLRQEAGLSQTELAESAGKALNTISLIEVGTTEEPKRPTLEAIAAVLTSKLGRAVSWRDFFLA